MAVHINVTVWNEFLHEKQEERVGEIYPDGIHGAIKGFLDKKSELNVRTATLDQPEHGLTQEVLDDTDVLLWWGHRAHNEVSDEVVERVYRRVMDGMGLIVLHSAHASKIFRKLCGTETQNLCWRESDDRELLWVVEPNHPIARGIEGYIDLEHEETYGERFHIPTPDEIVFIGWFEGGEVFRSGCTFKRGLGKIFYFQPGHESYPIYHHPQIQRIIENAVFWANADFKADVPTQHMPVRPIDRLPQ